MRMNLRCDDKFVQDEGWYTAANHYDDFICRRENLHILFLELGVRFNTPVIIKFPFWQMAEKNPKAVLCLRQLWRSMLSRGNCRQIALCE